MTFSDRVPRQQQFGITSFLPKHFSTTISGVPEEVSSRNTGKRRRERDRVVEHVEISDDDDDDDAEEDEKDTVTSKRVRTQSSGTQSEVIDLTATDDEDPEEEDMPPPPVPVKKTRRVKSPSKKRIDKGKQVKIESNDDGEEVMWVDRFGPSSKEELAIHAKKLADVSNWFTETFPANGPTKLSAKYRRLLVLSGPSGSGKTSCLRMLAKEFNVEVLEWKEDSNVVNANDDYSESMVNRFTSFLARAGMVPALDFVNADEEGEYSDNPSSPIASTSTLALTTETSRRRLILLEDLPNISHFQTKQSFRSALAQYLASPRVTCPLVVIVSEALARPGMDSLETAGAGGGFSIRGDENVDSRSVCGLQILQHPACREIPFNPIAPTIMKKALNRTLDQVYSTTSSSLPQKLSPRPSVTVLDTIIQNSNGDIRSALMSLQFLAMNSSTTTMATTSTKSVKGKGRKKAKTEARGGKEILQFVTARENSLFIFHALGKVLYNKRWGESVQDDKKDLNRPGILQEKSADARLPKHLREEWTRNPSKVDPDVLFAEAPVDSDIFLTYLHHNYPQFTANSIESCSRILDALSISDSVFQLDSNHNNDARRSALTSMYSFDTAVRGCLMGLPSPVPREKQILKKSEWWDNENLRKSNVEGVYELVSPSPLNRPRGTEGHQEEGEVVVTNLMTKDRKSLLTELIPWLGVIETERVNPFLQDLAQFPPLSFDSTITGAALNEKDVKLEGDEWLLGEGEEVMKRLEEVDEAEEKPQVEVNPNTEGTQDEWYEVEDDIIDGD